METQLSAVATGVATFAGDVVLDAFFPAPQLGTKPAEVTLAEPNNASELVTKRVVQVPVKANGKKTRSTFFLPLNEESETFSPN